LHHKGESTDIYYVSKTERQETNAVLSGKKQLLIMTFFGKKKDFIDN
jgi:hypothetical protein